MKLTNLRNIRSVAGLAMAIAIGAQMPSARLNAQATADSATTETTSLDTMIVTGSAIPTAEEVGFSPVDTLTSATIEKTGTVDILEALRRSNPGFVGGGNLGSSNANIASNSTYGGSAIALRDLPTLVLLDGRRVADSSAAAAGGSVFSDVNLFPTSLIERIEVLKDGASALYGSDAIGGVVNIILKKNFEGFESGYRYGFADQDTKDGKTISTHKAYALFGVNTEKARIVIGGQYTEQDPIYTRDRDIGVPTFGTTTYGGIIDQFNIDGGPFLQGINEPSDTVGTFRPSAGNLNPNGNPTTGGYDSVTFDEIFNGFDLSQVPTATLEQRKVNFYANAEYDILEDKALTVFGSFLYSQNYSKSLLNAQPISSFSQLDGVYITIPAGAPTNPYGVDLDYSAFFDDILDDPNTPDVNEEVPETLLNNPPVGVRNRFTQFPRIFEQDTNFFRGVGGLKGSLLQGDLGYEVAYNVSKNTINYKNSNLVIFEGLQNALASGQLNLFTPGDQITGSQLDGVLGTDFLELVSQQRIFDFKLNAFPIELPAGKLGIAIGGEYREEDLQATSGPAIFVASTPVQAIDATRDITAVYGEVLVPLIGGDYTFPGFHRLDFSMAFRFEKYSDAGDSGVPKMGITYQPIKDLLFRATYSKSFIAPTLYQSQGPLSQGFTSAITLNGNPQDQAQSRSGANPDLEPSKADNYNLGFVYTPSFAPGLKISLDYFNIEQEGLVGSVTAQTILSSVEALGTASPFAGLVSFGSFDGPGVTGPGQLDGNLINAYVTSNNQNLGGQKVEGLDGDIAYQFKLSSKSALTIGASAVYFTNYDYAELPTDEFVNLAGINTDGGSNLPEWRMTSFVTYEWGGLTADLIFDYQPATDNGIPYAIADLPFVTNFEEIDEYYTFDGRISYEFGKNKSYDSTAAVAGTYDKDGKTVSAPVAASVMKRSLLDGLTVAAGVNNIFDREPPFITDATDNTDLAAFDVTGRYFYFEVSKKF